MPEEKYTMLFANLKSYVSGADMSMRADPSCPLDTAITYFRFKEKI